MKKRLFPLILVCCALAALLLVSVTAADDIVASGNCGAEGDNVQWTLDNKGNLTISGKGCIADYSANSINGYIHGLSCPWYGNASMITSLVINEGVTEIGAFAFGGLERLSKVTLPDSLIRVKESAFRQCYNLTKITLPDGVSNIEDFVFAKCSNLVSFTISDKVTSIGYGSFWDCDHLAKIVIPKNVENMSVGAFSECDGLKSVTILGEIPIIKKDSFWKCFSLTEITIPDSVLVIENHTFNGCDALTDVYYTGTEDMWKEISIDGDNEPLENATIHADTSPGGSYRINKITVSGGTKGEGAIPQGSFLATMSVTNRASSAIPMICLVAYTADGQFQDFVYVTVKEPVGATVEVTLPVDNSAGNIAQLRAFAVKSLSDMSLIGNSISFS